MARVFIGIGSNIDPERHVRAAVRLLSEQVTVRAVSTVYATEPLERPDQPRYYNCVVEIETTVPPLDLKQQILRPVELRLGRVRTSDAFAARTIDLDLILYDDLVMESDAVTLPDPDILKRPFLAIPLAELAPGLKLPGSGDTIDVVAAAMGRDVMMPLPGFTELLRKEIIHGPE